MNRGITFTVYDSREGIVKIFLFDIIPRLITSSEWSFIKKGIKQRLKDLNLFLKDVYSNQFILKDKIVPINIIYSYPNFLREMHNAMKILTIRTIISSKRRLIMPNHRKRQQPIENKTVTSNIWKLYNNSCSKKLIYKKLNNNIDGRYEAQFHLLRRLCFVSTNTDYSHRALNLINSPDINGNTFGCIFF